jgi:hypothetical protein
MTGDATRGTVHPGAGAPRPDRQRAAEGGADGVRLAIDSRSDEECLGPSREVTVNLELGVDPIDDIVAAYRRDGFVVLSGLEAGAGPLLTEMLCQRGRG